MHTSCFDGRLALVELGRMATRQFLNRVLFAMIRLCNAASNPTSLSIPHNSHLVIAHNKMHNSLQKVFPRKSHHPFCFHEDPVQLLLFPLHSLCSFLCFLDLKRHSVVMDAQVFLFTSFFIQLKVTLDVLSARRIRPDMKRLALATFLDEPFIAPEQSSHGKP